MFVDHLPQRSLSASLVDTAGSYSSEQAFIESLEAIISSSGSTQQHCIAQLRSLGLPDDFWMYVFKVVPCAKTYSHKWTLCPCAHAGETARRRDPRVVSYKAVLCPIVKGKKTCPLGDACSYAHNVFEHWLHPSRYKTRLCSFGRNCNRPICFFAHSAEELRCMPNQDDGKELDEREYMLQVMMAQQHGQLLGGRALGSISSPATPMNGVHTPVSAFTPHMPDAGTPNTAPHGGPQLPSFLDPSGPSGGAGMGSNMAALMSPLRGAKSMHPGLGIGLPHGPGLPGMGDPGMHQLFGLQEALAAMSFGSGMDGLQGLHGAGGGANASATRGSDPGLPAVPGNNDAASRALSSLGGALSGGPGARALSDNGGAHPLSGLAATGSLPANLESLLPFMTSALQQQQQQQQQLSERHSMGGSTPGPQPHQGGSPTTPGTGHARPNSGGSLLDSQDSAPAQQLAPSSSAGLLASLGANLGMGLVLTPPTPTQQPAAPSNPPTSSPPHSPAARSHSPSGSAGSGGGDAAAVGSPGGAHHQSMSTESMAHGGGAGAGSAAPTPTTSSRPSAPGGGAPRPPPHLLRAASSGSMTHRSSIGAPPAFGTRQPDTLSAGATSPDGSGGSGSGPNHQQAALSSLIAAATASVGGSAGGVAPSAVSKIVQELQEQGLAGSKDQLVASLSQLLAQLLSANT